MMTEAQGLRKIHGDGIKQLLADNRNLESKLVAAIRSCR